MKKIYLIAMSLFLVLFLARNGHTASNVSAPQDFSAIKQFSSHQINDLNFVDGVPKRLVIKFNDNVRPRFNSSQNLFSLSNVDLTDVLNLTKSLRLQLHKLINLPDDNLEALKQRSETLSGRPQKDLNAFIQVNLPAFMSDAQIAQIASLLEQLNSVEYVYLEPLAIEPPGDIAPPTPNLASFQGYFTPDPGLDVASARALGITGTGIRLSDCEYGLNRNHEDLVDKVITIEPGQTINPQVFSLGYDEHGTAVAGIGNAVENNYGINGIAPLVDYYFYPEWTVEESYRRVTAITHAIANSKPGDVVLLEMQTIYYGNSYGPAELDPAVWSAVKQGTDAGVIVVAAAGNGAQDLDSATYASYMSRGDSGAILVGAGTNDAYHSPLSFTTFGSRVNVQSWGTGVFTLGYGDFAEYGSDPNQKYTANFNGTSSASALVASSVSLLQSYAVSKIARRLTPVEMRNIIINTGIAQGAGVHVGPGLNIKAAMNAIDAIKITLESHWLEAEYPSSIVAPMTPIKDATASNGVYVYVSPSDTSNIIGSATYTFKITQPGDYVIWGLNIAANNSRNSFGVAVDSAPAKIWNIPLGTTWKWNPVIVDGTTPAKFTFTTGTHTLTIVQSEKGTKLDKILVTNDSSLIPTGKGEPGEIESHWVEAETYTSRVAPMTVVVDTAASKGKYITVPTTTTSKTQGLTTYTINITTPGNYLIYGRDLSPNSSQNAFYVSMDAGADKNWVTQISSSFIWDKANDSGIANPVVFPLTQGKHTLTIKQNKKGTQLDKLLITNDPNLVPSGLGQTAGF